MSANLVDKKVKQLYSSLWDHTVLPATQLTQVNMPHLNSSHAERYSIYLPQRNGRLSWPWCWLYTEMVYLSADSHPSRL